MIDESKAPTVAELLVKLGAPTDQGDLDEMLRWFLIKLLLAEADPRCDCGGQGECNFCWSCGLAGQRRGGAP